MTIRRLLLAAVAASAWVCALPALAQTPGGAAKAGTPSAAPSAPRAIDAWARPTVPGQPGGGAFLTLEGGRVADRLVAARSDVAQRVELHSMRMVGNVMQMRQVSAIDVPAGQKVSLAPGGWHLMFSGLKQPLKVGERFPLVLHFERAGNVTVQVEVKTQDGMPADAAMPMDMKMH